MNTDLSGMYFTEGSKQYINRYLINIFIRFIPDVRCLYRSLYDDRSFSRDRQELMAMLDEFSVLESSETPYNVVIDDRTTTEDGTPAGMTTYDMGHNWINIILYDERMDLFSHEMKHAYQFETGEFSLGLNITRKKDKSFVKKKYTAGAPYYDQNDEIEAYDRGLLFGGERWENVKDNKCYRKLGATSLGWHSSMFGTTEDRSLQHNSNKFSSCFKANGKLFLPQEE